MKQVLRFLHSLSLHNDKVWFDSHKADYLKAKDTVGKLAERLIEGVRSFDDTIGPLSAAECTYRIYRDIRFSKDKSPYKTHMGIFINRGGKKSGYSGYYFHVDGNGGHLLAIGDYYTEPRVLKTIREDIELGGGDFRRILAGAAPGLFLDTDGALKKVPKGFPAESPDAEFFKLKNFCLLQNLDEGFVLSPQLEENVLEIFRSGKPFLDYI
ncbi:MAG: DUF2461 domain-containing protein, partial [Bacteroidales bacterium]|nr:DUF2461 domain-containing protein [Bacteroidales bacterium]